MVFLILGAVAERVKLTSYMIFATINTGLIYVFPAHWFWDENGWLYGKGIDFAGSSVVHMSGGIAALSATLLLGPRIGKYNGRRSYYMASPTNVVLGTFFLWWGWIGFNCGSTFAMSNGKLTVPCLINCRKQNFLTHVLTPIKFVNGMII